MDSAGLFAYCRHSLLQYIRLRLEPKPNVAGNDGVLLSSLRGTK